MTTATARRIVLTGNEAAAWAARLARVRAGVFYPIGPADEVLETFSRWVQKGEIKDAAVTQMQNEKGAVAAEMGLVSSGIRSIFATADDGVLVAMPSIVASIMQRVPLLFVISSRAFEPISISCDYADFLSLRTLGILMFYCESPQDALDTILQAYRVAEDPSVLLPVAVGYDGWGVSHAPERCTLPDQEAVDEFLPPLALPPLKTKRNSEATEIPDLFSYDQAGPTLGYAVDQKERRRHPMAPPWGMEMLYKRWLSLREAKRLIKGPVANAYRQISGRDHVGLVETYRMEDADTALVTMGMVTATARFLVDALRAETGEKMGVVKIRCFQPFPDEEIAEALTGVRAAGVISRDPMDNVFRDVKAALQGFGVQPLLLGRSVGVAGRDPSYFDVARVAEHVIEAAQTGAVTVPFDYEPVRGRSR